MYKPALTSLLGVILLSLTAAAQDTPQPDGGPDDAPVVIERKAVVVIQDDDGDSEPRVIILEGDEIDGLGLDLGDLPVLPGGVGKLKLKDGEGVVEFDFDLSGMAYGYTQEGCQEAYLLALLEHQSSVDPIMAARVLVYVGRAIDRHLREHPNARRVPAVIPVVLYHGKGRWTAATDLFDLYALPEGAEVAFRGLVPSLRFLLDDLSRIPDEELRKRPGPVLARLALIVMRHAHELRLAEDPRQAMHEIAVSVGDLLQQVLDRTGRTGVFRYMLEIVELEAKEGEEILVRALPDKIKEDVVSHYVQK